MSEKIKRILLAIDSTEESLMVVRSVSRALRPGCAEIVVYQVMSKVPEVFYDLGRDPVWLPKIEAVREWEQKQEEYAAGFMTKTIDIFQDGGFDPAAVTTRIGIQSEGITRDIVAEARRGYDVVIIGRGRSGSLRGRVLGGVASKLVTAVPSPSLWLIGREPRPGRILVAMDSSEHSLKAVYQVGRLLNRDNCAITLFHAIRGISVSARDMEEIFPESYRMRLLEEAEKEIRPALRRAEVALQDMDISPERITTRIVTGVSSRAAAIIDEAERGGYGTIVAGRRGVSNVADFSIGRVTNKLTQLATKQALCIVG